MTRMKTVLTALLLAGLASAAVAGAAAPAPAPAAKRLVVIEDDTRLMFGDEIIGRLAEGTRLDLVKSHEDYALVRATFGKNWVQGWVRSSFTVPDSLDKIDVKVGQGVLNYAYGGAPAPAGNQFLEVHIRFTGAEGAPPRVYLDFAESAKDLVVSYGRESKALVYGFMRRRPGSKQRFFEKTEKSQIVLLKPGEMLEETYIFVVPSRATRFELILKGKPQLIRLRR